MQANQWHGLFVCGVSLTSGQLVKGSSQTGKFLQTELIIEENIPSAEYKQKSIVLQVCMYEMVK